MVLIRVPSLMPSADTAEHVATNDQRSLPPANESVSSSSAIPETEQDTKKGAYADANAKGRGKAAALLALQKMQDTQASGLAAFKADMAKEPALARLENKLQQKIDDLVKALSELGNVSEMKDARQNLQDLGYLPEARKHAPPYPKMLSEALENWISEGKTWGKSPDMTEQTLTLYQKLLSKSRQALAKEAAENGGANNIEVYGITDPDVQVSIMQLEKEYLSFALDTVRSGALSLQEAREEFHINDEPRLNQLRLAEAEVADGAPVDDSDDEWSEDAEIAFEAVQRGEMTLQVVEGAFGRAVADQIATRLGRH